MRRFILLLVIVAPLSILLLAGAGRGALRAAPQNGAAQPKGVQQDAGEVSMTTGGGLFGPVRERFRAGESIPVVISMTNEGGEPIYVCDSSTIYQDRPRLLKDGRPLPYEGVQKTMMQTSERDKTCENLDEDIDLPEQRLVKPGETAVVDWFILTE